MSAESALRTPTLDTVAVDLPRPATPVVNQATSPECAPKPVDKVDSAVEPSVVDDLATTVVVSVTLPESAPLLVVLVVPAAPVVLEE